MLGIFVPYLLRFAESLGDGPDVFPIYAVRQDTAGRDRRQAIAIGTDEGRRIGERDYGKSIVCIVVILAIDSRCFRTFLPARGATEL